jgi:RNA 2',3'-cyclic 3'-phosphodiesterase
VRLFVAAHPSEEVRTAAVRCADRLRARLEHVGASHGIRWIPAGNMHLTVWFLGEVSDARAGAVLDALRPPLTVRPFTLQVSGFGAFPPSGPPRVLWMGVTEGLEGLALLHEEVGSRLQPWGFRPEGRAYSAHLTIARLKEPPHGAARAAIRHAVMHEEADAGSCRVDHLLVFRSRTSPSGAAYEPLLRVPLT